MYNAANALAVAVPPLPMAAASSSASWLDSAAVSWLDCAAVSWLDCLLCWFALDLRCHQPHDELLLRDLRQLPLVLFLVRNFVGGRGRHRCGGDIGSGGLLFIHCPGFSLGRCGFAPGGGFSSTCICVGAAATLLLSVDAAAALVG